VQPRIDTARANAARMYDFFLGGKDHFAIDREIAGKVLREVPEARVMARENRSFLRRAVRYLAAEAGIRQFLDVGTGMPGPDNVHEVAQRIAPECRVVYVDNDPVVLAHARALLTSAPRGETAYIQADLRDPEKILADPVTRNVLDFSQPVALTLIAVLPFVLSGDDAANSVATLVGALPPGSYLALSHATADDYDEARMAEAAEVYGRAGVPARPRSEAEIRELTPRGLELVPPGLVPLSRWRPDGPPARRRPASPGGAYGAVARKP